MVHARFVFGDRYVIWKKASSFLSPLRDVSARKPFRLDWLPIAVRLGERNERDLFLFVTVLVSRAWVGEHSLNRAGLTGPVSMKRPQYCFIGIAKTVVCRAIDRARKSKSSVVSLASGLRD